MNMNTLPLFPQKSSVKLKSSGNCTNLSSEADIYHNYLSVGSYLTFLSRFR